MADVLINHAFVSAKPDSPDNTIVSSGEWNAPELLRGGSNGQTIVADDTSSTGGRWTDGPQTVTTTGSYTGASPSGDLASSVVSFSSTCFLQCVITAAITTSNSSAGTVTLYRDGVAVRNGGVQGTGIDQPCVFHMIAESPGTHTYSVRFTTQGGATITAGGATLILTKFGR